MNRKIASTSMLAIASCLFIAVIIIANTTLTSWRIDLTENKLFTLSDGTLSIISKLEEPISLDFYFSQSGLIGYPALVNYGVRVRDILQEYATHSDGMLQLNIIEPERFSEAEDQAVASGLQSVTLNSAGDRAYLGLVGTNSTDDERVIGFFQSSRESALEYDITKLIYNLAYPKKPRIGIISSLPLFGDGRAQLARWSIVNTIGEFFEIEDLGTEPEHIRHVDVLMIVHPKDLSQRTLYIIDQYVLKGGKAIVFVDPMAESDRSIVENPNSAVLPDVDSELTLLLDKWGAEVLEQKIAGDINAAMRVQTRTQQGTREISYLPWLRFAEESFNQDDFVTNELKVIHLGTAGIIEKKAGSTTEFIPLMQTTTQSMQLERDFLIIQRDPQIILDSFKSSDKKYTLAARLQGTAETAFPDGKPAVDSGETEQAVDTPETVTDTNFVSKGQVNVMVVSDTDILSDIFWVRNQSIFGMEIAQPIANNGDFVVNALESLSGSQDLASLRTRGGFTRPFEKVEAIQREAERKYRSREQKLIQTLRETEQNILQLQQEQDGGSDSALLLSKEQREAIGKFQQLLVDTRKELRAVQHELRKNIESLKAILRFINIVLMPLLIILVAIGVGVYRTVRQS